MNCLKFFHRHTAAFILSMLILSLPKTQAQWSDDPAVNNPICTADNYQSYPTIITDGSGGAIITWQDARSGTYQDIYAQKINSSGVVQWTANGVAICTAASERYSPTIASDGSGGAIITWRDNRNGNLDIYAQKINSSGAVQWTADGVAICTASGNQLSPTIVSDGSGGAIITWFDYRSGTNQDIYAQKINSSGAVQWTANGVEICTASGDQDYPSIVSDGSGGAIITWPDYRSGTNYDIYAQKINSSGSVQWTANGVEICTASGSQKYPTITSDGSGGAIITWQDLRSGTNQNIYAQKINSSGSVQWTANGVAICTASGERGYPAIVSDGSGGALITWNDYRSGTNWDIYAQKINSSGAVQWTANGVAICTSSYDQGLSVTGTPIVSDGSGGSIITWNDSRSGPYDIYSQKINSSGSVQWTANGVAICTASGHQENSTIVSDGSSGAIITWQDSRSGTYTDIYASRVYSNGALPVELISFTAKAQGNRIDIQWKTATEVNNYGFDVERSAISLNRDWEKIGFVQGHGNSNSPKEYSFTDSNPPSGKVKYRLKQIDFDGKFEYSNEIEVNVEIPVNFALHQNYPNPFNPITTIKYSIPQSCFVNIIVYDVLGREIKKLASEEKQQGNYEVKFNGSNLASGVYFYSLSTGNFTQTKKIVLMK